MAVAGAGADKRAKRRQRLAYLLRHPHHALWHPHQRLWNLYLTPVAKRIGLGKPLILADTLLLWAEAGLRRLGRRKDAASRKLILFDLGQHIDARQVRAMLDWFAGELALEVHAFEANPDYFEAARETLSAFPNVRLEKLALVGPDFKGDHVKLYLAGGRGVGDSIYARRSEAFISVPAIRLSRYIEARGIDLSAQPVMLRMNIEGAEMGVLEDLAEADMLSEIDGFFGAWDDMYKIDPADDERFRAFLRRHRIRSIPFNDRDLGEGWPFGLRQAAIRFAVRTVLRR